MWPNVYNVSALYTWTAERQFGLTMTPNLKLILWYHDKIGIDTSFSVMAVTPQTPKCHHNLGCASVVVTFGSLWCHSHDRKLGINSFIIHYKCSKIYFPKRYFTTYDFQFASLHTNMFNHSQYMSDLSCDFQYRRYPSKIAVNTVGDMPLSDSSSHTRNPNLVSNTIFLSAF